MSSLYDESIEKSVIVLYKSLAEKKTEKDMLLSKPKRSNIAAYFKSQP